MRPALFLFAFSSMVSLSSCTGTLPVDAGADTARLDAPSEDSPDTAPFDAPLDAGPLDADPPDADEDASEADADGDAAMDAPLDAAPDAPSIDAPSLDVPSDAPITRSEDMTSHPAVPPIPPFTTCTVTTSTDMISNAMHLVPCSTFDYPFLPPSAGPHYSLWANFGTYTAPVPWGFLVHSMEHGAVVLAYNCAVSTDCDAVRTELQAIIDDHGVDPLCRDQDWPNRIIVVPDPTLTVPIAAVAWRNVYTATCLDPTSLRAFVDAHYGMATESLCAPGVDRSATSWCP